MKKASIMVLILVLTATLFSGCRNMNNNPSTTTPVPSSTARPTVKPMPDLPRPTGSSDPNGSNIQPGGSEGTTTPGRAMRPSARGPQY